jgi:hypothetical protein
VRLGAFAALVVGKDDLLVTRVTRRILAIRVVNLVLDDGLRKPEHSDPNGDEGDADDEESGQDGARREDWLPGGQTLLLERRI